MTAMLQNVARSASDLSVRQRRRRCCRCCRRRHRRPRSRRGQIDQSTIFTSFWKKRPNCYCDDAPRNFSPQIFVTSALLLRIIKSNNDNFLTPSEELTKELERLKSRKVKSSRVFWNKILKEKDFHKNQEKLALKSQECPDKLESDSSDSTIGNIWMLTKFSN